MASRKGYYSGVPVILPYGDVQAMHIGVLEVAVRIGLVLATAFLFGIIFLSYRRLRSRKMLLISVGFGVFFVHALISLPELVNDAWAIALNEEMHLLIPLVGLVFILLGILQD